MPWIAVLCGLLLAAVSAVSHFDPEIIGKAPETDSPTKWIPAGFGAALVLLGLISLAGQPVRKHAMHLAAMVGLLGIVGGVAMTVVKLIKGQEVPSGTAAFRAQMLMALISLFFLWACIRSFIAARKARQAAAPLG